MLFSKVLLVLGAQDWGGQGRQQAELGRKHRINKEPRPSLEWRIRFTRYGWKGFGDVLVQNGTYMGDTLMEKPRTEDQ